MSLINTQIKPFKAKAYHNGQFITVTDNDLKGKWSVVFFYPADFSFVCPTELGDLADHYEEFKKMGVEIYSVSTDTHFVHKGWHDASDTIKKIQFPMVGDPSGKISRDFNVLIEEDGVALRGTFVINPEGQIKLYEIHDLGRPFRYRTDPQDSGRTIRCHPQGSGMPGILETGQRNAGTISGSGRQDLIFVR